MKKHLFLKSLLVAIGLLIASINTAWAVNWNLTSSERLYIDCTNWDGDNAKIKLSVYGTNEQFWKDVYPTHLKDHIYYWDVDGDCRGFKVTRLSSDGKSSWNWTGVAWAKNRSNNDEYLMTLGSCSNDGTPTWSYGPYSMSSGYTFYFNNSVMQVATPNLRIGRTNYCTATGMSLENGTRYLYSCSTSNWQGYEAITVADKASYTGSGHSIYGKGGDSYLVTKTTNHHKASVSTNIYANATGTSGTSDGVTYYTTSYSTSLPTYSASISSTSNGTLAVYKYTSNNYETNKNSLTNFSQISNGATGLLPTQILKIVTTPYSNCELISLSVSGATKIEDVTGGSTYYVTGNVTISATFGTLYSVSITKNDASMGSVSTSSVLAGSTTHPEITATPSNGYYFVNWTSSTGSVSVASSTSATTTVTATATGTLTANFAKRFVLRGTRSNDSGDEGMPGFSTTTADMDISDGVSTKQVTLQPNREYKFMIYDHAHGRQCGYTTANNTLDADTKSGSLDGTYHLLMNTAGYGTYTFSVEVSDPDGSGNTWPRVTITNPDSKLLTLGRKVIYNEDNSTKYDATNTNGGTVTAHTNENSTGYDITTGQYFASGSNITFTATPATGYRVAGWYNDADCADNHEYTAGANVSISGDKNTLTLSSLTSATTVYVKFEEIMQTVKIGETGEHGTLTIGSTPAAWASEVKVGVHTTVTITATPATGYYFAQWYKFDGTTYYYTLNGYGEDYATATITGNPANSYYGTRTDWLQVSFLNLEKIYFKNWDKTANEGAGGQLWDSVYVAFDPHYDTYGPDVCGLSDHAFAMERCFPYEGYDTYYIWWTYVPRWVTKENKTKLVFFDKGVMRGYEHFDHYNATERNDYKKYNDMWVPEHESTGKLRTDGKVYNNGYWKNYYNLEGRGQGYYLQENKSGWTQLGEFTATEDGYSPNLQFTARIDNTSAHYYRIISAGGIYYNVGSTVTAGASTNLTLNTGGSGGFTLTPTSEGNYTFTINQTDEKMKLSVNYPIAVGDYILEHTYKDGSAKTTHSDVIKASEASTRKIYSMYLSDQATIASDTTLVLKKCESIDAGVISWSAGDATKLQGSGGVLSAIKGKKGVYQFYLTIDNGKVSTVDSLVRYTGNYYIKADSTEGGWANYTLNAMDKNTVNFDSTANTYDRYWCHYYYTNAANVKCVIANDYCNQLSDTLKGDGIARLDGTEPKVPKAQTSIRFSYNSITNTIERAYLGASLANDYLDIEPNEAGYVYKTDGTTDLYGKEVVDRRFEDQKNWVYEKEIKVKPGAKAGVSATFYDGVPTAHKQTFLPNSYVLLGGTGDDMYTIRVVYDFKTNYMMASFILPDAEHPINDALSDVDMLWVRHKDESAQQVNLGSGSLKDVRVIGAIELRYNEVHWLDGSMDMSKWTVTNRPYLKYFISFPFDVHVNSIFGLNQATYGLHYTIQKYNGAKRAADGLFAGDGDNYWENLTEDSIMHANEGYCLIFDNDYASGRSGSIWENKSAGSSVYLYFPADNEIASITNDNCTTKVAAHQCTIDRWWSGSAIAKNHIQTDSHWNLIGNPLFHDAYINDTTASDTFKLRSYYKLNYADNKWKAQAITGSTQFKAMSSVLVQWCGDIEWTNAPTSYAPAPRRTAEEATMNYLVQLDIEYNGVVSDWAYVGLEDCANDDFVLREDMLKYYNSGIPQIYTFAGAYDVAYNTLPIKNQTIPVGMIARKNGTYKFSMPTNFSGTVTLIDKYAQTRTNLNLDEYEVYLNKGTIDDRFELEINIKNAPTAIDGATDGSGSLKDGQAHKFIMNDMMYILKDGVIYDARGNRVK